MPVQPLNDSEVPQVAQLELIRGSSQALVYKNMFLEGYAKDHKPQPAAASSGRQTSFDGLQVEDSTFEEGKAQQKEAFRYKNTGTEDLPGDGDGRGGLAGSASAALVPGRPPAPAVAGEDDEGPPLARDVAQRLFDEWETRADNPLTFNKEQKAVVALVVGQVEAIVAYEKLSLIHI